MRLIRRCDFGSAKAIKGPRFRALERQRNRARRVVPAGAVCPLPYPCGRFDYGLCLSTHPYGVKFGVHDLDLSL